MKINELLDYINFRSRQGFEISKIISMMNASLNVYASMGENNTVNVTLQGQYYTLGPGRLSREYGVITIQ